jgi:hypothetical protein
VKITENVTDKGKRRVKLCETPDLNLIITSIFKLFRIPGRSLPEGFTFIGSHSRFVGLGALL